MTMESEKIAVEFGAIVREAREKQGLYQAEVAAKLGVSGSYYHYIETGKREIYFSLAVKICKVLKLDINELAKRL